MRAGEADKEDVERVFKTVCYHVKKGEALPPELAQYLAESFERYFASWTLASAFGIRKGKKGRKKTDGHTSAVIASCFLRHRLDGKGWDDALVKTCSEVHKSKSVVEDAWTNHRREGLILLRLEREPKAYPWSDAEVPRLCELYKNDKWFIPPGK